ncbi:ATP-dependent nuclease [Halococcus salifodinae]
MSNGQEASNSTIVTDIDYEDTSYSAFMQELSVVENPDMANRHNVSGISPSLNNRNTENLNTNQLEGLQTSGGDVTSSDLVRRRLMQFKVAFLNASSRLEIANSCETYNFHEGDPSNVLQKLYEAPSARRELNSAFNNIFQQDIVLDFSSTRTFSLRVDDDLDNINGNIVTPTGNPENDQEIGEKIDDQGAGYRSLAGVILSLLLAQQRVVLLDEPEAFLHPAQAREFGIWLSEHARSTSGQIVISTHNSHFLDGVLSGNAGTTVYRLNRSDDHTQYNKISEDVISNLSSDSLLSSLRVMNGVFQKGIVICEGGSDKLVYRYVADEILGERNAEYIPCNRIHNAPKIANVLRAGAIPQVIVADIDILSSPSIFRDSLEALSGKIWGV